MERVSFYEGFVVFLIFKRVEVIEVVVGLMSKKKIRKM